MTDAGAIVDGLLQRNMSALGRIVVEAREPHFIVAINGQGASLLQTTWSQVCGRRAGVIVQGEIERDRLGAALRRAQNLRRKLVYLKTFLQAGPALAVIQICEAAKEAGERLQISLLPAEACGPVLDCLDAVGDDEDPSQAKAQSAGHHNRCFDVLAVKLEDREAHLLGGMPGQVAPAKYAQDVDFTTSAVHQRADDNADKLAPSKTSAEDGPFATSTAAAAAQATTSSSPTSSACHIANNATKLTAESAVEIFKAGGPGAKRSGLSKVFAERYGITMKAVRDIWNLRTWTHVTMPFWSSEGLTTTSPGDEINQDMADAAGTTAATLARGYKTSERVEGPLPAGQGQQVFSKNTLTDAVPTERTESSCFDTDAVSGLLRSVPDNPCAYWSGTGLPVTQPVAYAAHALDCVAPAAPVVSMGQGAASTRLETTTEADEPNLTYDDAGNPFIDGWAIPRSQWLTPPGFRLLPGQRHG